MGSVLSGGTIHKIFPLDDSNRQFIFIVDTRWKLDDSTKVYSIMENQNILSAKLLRKNTLIIISEAHQYSTGEVKLLAVVDQEMFKFDVSMFFTAINPLESIPRYIIPKPLETISFRNIDNIPEYTPSQEIPTTTPRRSAISQSFSARNSTPPSDNGTPKSGDIIYRGVNFSNYGKSL